MNARETRNRVEVIDREGWRKEYPLNRAIFHIGSDTRNDIVLEGGRGAGIEARHAQLVATAGSRGYRLVNLSQTPIPLDGSGRILPPRGATDIYDRDVVRMGEHTFRFFLSEGSSNSISVSLHFGETRLAIDTLLEGVITVQNLGSVPGAQFKLAVEGLTPEWYALGPGPILFPGAQKDVLLHIRHARQPSIPAGPRPVTVRAVAPDAYPGESAAATQSIQIAPFYDHAIRLTLADVQ
ncbi:MAG: FHA domain-containing protein [Chloroflexi bacterium]|nr:FHA domain-containing protein [Chloroflexota bacterium]